MKSRKTIFENLPAGLIYSAIILTVMSGCGTSQAHQEQGGGAPPLPVIKAAALPATTFQDCPASV